MSLQKHLPTLTETKKNAACIIQIDYDQIVVKKFYDVTVVLVLRGSTALSGEKTVKS